MVVFPVKFVVGQNVNIMFKSFTTNGTLHKNGKYYENFGILKKDAKANEVKPQDVVKLTFEISDNQEKANLADFNIDYWGWYDKWDKKFIKIKCSRLALNMSYKMANEEKYYGYMGKAYRLKLVKK